MRSPATRKKRAQRPGRIELFAGELAIAGVHVSLTMIAGAHVIVLDELGDETERVFEGWRQLRLEKGLHAIVLGPGVEDVATLGVVGVDQVDGLDRYRCIKVSGQLAGDGRVHVMACGRPRKPAQLELRAPRKRSRRTALPSRSVLGSPTFPDASNGRAPHLSDEAST